MGKLSESPESKPRLSEGDVITVDDFDRLPKFVTLDVGKLLAPMWRTAGQWSYGANPLSEREAKSYIRHSGPVRIVKVYYLEDE